MKLIYFLLFLCYTTLILLWYQGWWGVAYVEDNRKFSIICQRHYSTPVCESLKNFITCKCS